jgi:hypothetical protein
MLRPDKREAERHFHQLQQVNHVNGNVSQLLNALFIDSPTTNQPRNQLATEILENLSKFPHCILLTRVGQFYEVSSLMSIPWLSR